MHSILRSVSQAYMDRKVKTPVTSLLFFFLQCTYNYLTLSVYFACAAEETWDSTVSFPSVTYATLWSINVQDNKSER